MRRGLSVPKDGETRESRFIVRAMKEHAHITGSPGLKLYFISVNLNPGKVSMRLPLLESRRMLTVRDCVAPLGVDRWVYWLSEGPEVDSVPSRVRRKYGW